MKFELFKSIKKEKKLTNQQLDEVESTIAKSKRQYPAIDKLLGELSKEISSIDTKKLYELETKKEIIYAQEQNLKTKKFPHIHNKKLIVDALKEVYSR